MNTHVAAIVVNYNTADLAIAAVESLLAQPDNGCRVAVHLVDNASPLGDAAVLQSAHRTQGWGDRVTLWLETKNHGFGRGNNVVLQFLARQEDPPGSVLLLNPDAQLHNAAVDLLAQALAQDPTAAAVGASVLRPDLTPVTAAFRFPNLISELARIINFGPLDHLAHQRLVPLPPNHAAGPVDWVSGASVMFRFNAIQDIGFFDPAFFLYYEEVDLMRRLHAAGWRVLYEPRAQVVHEEGAATGQFAAGVARKRDPDYLYQSWAYYFVQAHGRGTALVIALLHWPSAVLNLLHRGLRGKTPTIPRRFFYDHWRHVIRPLITGKIP